MVGPDGLRRLNFEIMRSGTLIAVSFSPMKRITDFVDWLVVMGSLVLFLGLEAAFLYGLYKLAASP